MTDVWIVLGGAAVIGACFLVVAVVAVAASALAARDSRIDAAREAFADVHGLPPADADRHLHTRSADPDLEALRTICAAANGDRS